MEIGECKYCGAVIHGKRELIGCKMICESCAEEAPEYNQEVQDAKNIA